MWKFIILVCVATNVLGDSCDLHTADPLLVVADQNFKICLPEDRYFSYGEIFYIRCPQGRLNTLISENGEMVACEGGNTIRIIQSGESINFDSIQCYEKSPLNVQNSDETCLTTRKLLNIGYEIYNNFAKFVEVCFDKTQLTPLTVHVNTSYWLWDEPSLNGTEAHWYSDIADLYGTNVDVFYSKTNQKMFFGYTGLSEYITDEIYLVRGQLIPSFVFYDPTEKYAAFDYSTIVPIWSTLYSDWIQSVYWYLVGVETESFYAGTLGIATLTNSGGIPVSIHMFGDGHVPVPRWLWVRDARSNYTTYGYNNPYYNLTEVKSEFQDLCPLGQLYQEGQLLIGGCEGSPTK